MALVTIITPTYNRRDLLPVLFQSLKSQSVKDFEWLVVDDGSADDTQEYIESLKTDNLFPIHYIKKINGGKHTALNVGIKMIDTPLTIIVDSDDSLLPNAVELIVEYYKKYNDHKEIGAFSFLRCNKQREPILSLDREEYVDSYIKCRIRENRPGDMAEVFLTSILKKFPFAEFEGERFLSEDVVWIQIGLAYEFVFINRAIYQCEYLSGGLTDSDKPMKFASPLGSMLRGKMLMRKECGLKARLKGAIIYNCYLNEVNSGIPNNIQPNSMNERTLLIVTKLLGVYFNKKWKRRQIF